MTPTNAIYQLDRKTTLLRFENDDTDEYYLRGGVCWPVVAKSAGGSGIAIGHIVLVGFNLRTKLYTVFDDAEFRCIDAVVQGARAMRDMAHAEFTKQGFDPLLVDQVSQPQVQLQFYLDNNAGFGRRVAAVLQGVAHVFDKPADRASEAALKDLGPYVRRSK